MKYTRDFLVFGIYAIMAYLVYRDPGDKILQGAMIAAFGAAYGYYLNASKTGSETAKTNADAMAAMIGRSDPQPVTVVNDEDAPVPVEAK